MSVRTHSSPARSLVLAVALVAALLQWTAPAASAAAPSNDDRAGAVVVSTLPCTTTVDTSEATSAADDDPPCGAATVWYAFTPPASAAYRVSAASAAVPVVLGMSGPDIGSVCYFGDASGVATIQFLTGGNTYLVEVATNTPAVPGQVGPGGPVVVGIEGPPPPLTVTATVDSVLLGAVPGTVVLSGTLRCNRDIGFAGIGGLVVQKQGRVVVSAQFGSGVPACSPTPSPWTTTSFLAERVFLPHTATVTGSTGGCDAFTCVDFPFTTTVKVRSK